MNGRYRQARFRSSPDGVTGHRCGVFRDPQSRIWWSVCQHPACSHTAWASRWRGALILARMHLLDTLGVEPVADRDLRDAA